MGGHSIWPAFGERTKLKDEIEQLLEVKTCPNMGALGGTVNIIH